MKKLLTALCFIVLFSCEKSELIENIKQPIDTATKSKDMAKSGILPIDYNYLNNTCGTMIVGAGSYDGSNINMTQVKSALNESNTNLVSLCNSPNINKWAAFKSGKWLPSTDYVTGTYNWGASTDGFRLGDFIGYNPNAKPPVHYSTALPSVINLEMFDELMIQIRLARGEMNPVALEGSKTKVDIQTTLNPSEFGAPINHNRISIPAVGSVYSNNVYFSPTYNSTILIKPTYYKTVGSEFEDVAVIEDGLRSISINIINPLFTGSINTLSNATGGNPLSKTIVGSLTRGAGDKSIYVRFLITGTGINTVVVNMGLIAFTSNQTQSIRPLAQTIQSQSGGSTTVLIQMQVSNTYEFTNLFQVAQTSFVWTNPGLPQ